MVLLSAKVTQLTPSFVLERCVFRNDFCNLMSFFPDLFFDCLPFWISSYFSYFLIAFFFFSWSCFPPDFIWSLFLTLIPFSVLYLSFLHLYFLTVPFYLFLSILIFIFPLLYTLFLFCSYILYLLGTGIPQSVY